MIKYERCGDCYGTGLMLNVIGEPDMCRTCKGDTVVPVEEYEGGNWKPIDEDTPKDRTILVFAPGAEYCLSDLMCTCLWHPDAGFCVDELRGPTMWQELPAPPMKR